MLENIAARAPAVVLAVLGPDARITDLREVNAGTENHLFALDTASGDGAEVRRLVLKLYSGGGAKAARNETKVMIALHAQGFPVPRILHVEQDERLLGRAFSVMERIEGRTLGAVMRAAEPAAAGRWLRSFAELAARLHALDPAPFVDEPHDAAWHLQQELARCEQALRDLEVPEFRPVLDWLTARSRELPARGPSLIHQDYHPLNVMVDERGELYVLDWTLARVTDPRSDLAQTFQMLASAGFASLRDPISAAYEAASGRALDGMAFFDVLAALKNVAGQYAVLDGGADKRPQLWAMQSRRPGFAQRVDRLRASATALERTYRTIVELSGVHVPEAEALFARLLA